MHNVSTRRFPQSLLSTSSLTAMPANAPAHIFAAKLKFGGRDSYLRKPPQSAPLSHYPSSHPASLYALVLVLLSQHAIVRCHMPRLGGHDSVYTSGRNGHIPAGNKHTPTLPLPVLIVEGGP